MANSSKQSSIEPLVRRVCTEVSSLEQQLRKDNPPMAPEERRSMPKARREAERVGRLVLQLGREYGVQVPGTTHDLLDSALSEADDVERLLTAAQGLLAAAEDLALRNRAGFWNGTMDIYSVLQRMARKNPTLRRQIEPIAEILAQRSPEATARRDLKRAERAAARAAARSAKANLKAQNVKSRRATSSSPAPSPTDTALLLSNGAANGANGTSTANGVSHQ